MGKLDPQEFHLGQEVFNLGDNCNTATSTANFIQDLMETKQVEVHFFERIKELSIRNLTYNVRFPNFIWSEGEPNLISCPSPWILTPREFSL
jgi:hypothetical protein